MSHDIGTIAAADYNFKDRQISKPNWIKEDELETTRLKLNTKKNIKENFERPSTPVEEVKDEVDSLTERFKVAIMYK